MSRFHIILSIMISMLFIFVSTDTLAQDTHTTTTTTTTSADGTVVEKREITTTIPAPKEVLPIPSGYVSCFTVKAGWYQDVWVADRRVCTYSNAPQGVVWIEG